jgi:hypothetical protein
MSDFKKCIACAEEILVEAKLCKHCRTVQDSHNFQTKELGNNQAEAIAVQSKSRSAALVLTVLFSFWSFLYTYRIDKTKFWTLFLVQSFLLVIYAVYRLWVGANTYDLFMNQGISVDGLIGGANLFFAFLQVPGWIYSVVVQISRTNAFFSQYPRLNK